MFCMFLFCFIQDEIKALLRWACTLIPPPLPMVCNFIIDKYLDILARLIISADPNVVCSTIKLCQQVPQSPVTCKLPVIVNKHMLYKCINENINSVYLLLTGHSKRCSSLHQKESKIKYMHSKLVICDFSIHKFKCFFHLNKMCVFSLKVNNLNLKERKIL